MADIANLQVTPKNRWSDGSLKFAVIAGRTALAANQPRTVLLTVGAASAGNALSLADLKATGVTAAIGCGAFGSVQWAGTDWDSPFQAWVSGPEMSSWIYRKPVGSDAHLVGWLEVRLFAGGAVEVLPWIENGYLNVAGPTSKTETFSFMLGGATRFSQALTFPHHTRSPLVGGTALSYWLGTDPAVTPRHNAAYLQATELVPTYEATVAPSAAIVTALPATYAPLQQGSFRYAFTPTNLNTGFDRDDMSTGGYGAPIGLLPEHDVLYLTTAGADVTVYSAVVRNGYSAGRYAAHYRDETTNRPLRFSSYPTLVIRGQSSPTNDGFKDEGQSTTGTYTPAASGTSPAGWDVAHSPSVGFMAYLLTGRWYFMEEVQFSACFNYLGNGDNSILRNGAQNLVRPCQGAWQTRSCAWAWRTLTQALCITPDEDTALRNEFIASVQSNIDHFYSRYVAQSHNEFGCIEPGESYDNTTGLLAIWQQDFVTAAFGYSVSMGLPLSSTYLSRLSSFFAWKAQSIVGRLGPSTSFWYINGDPYVIRIATGNPNYSTGAGPWFASWAAVYADQPAALALASSPSTWRGTTEGTLYGEFMPGANATWGNLQPALAYAVRHNVTGAQAAYNRMTTASNWGALRDAFNTAPVWGVKPAV